MITLFKNIKGTMTVDGQELAASLLRGQQIWWSDIPEEFSVVLIDDGYVDFASVCFYVIYSAHGRSLDVCKGQSGQ